MQHKLLGGYVLALDRNQGGYVNSSSSGVEVVYSVTFVNIPSVLASGSGEAAVYTLTSTDARSKVTFKHSGSFVRWASVGK